LAVRQGHLDVVIWLVQQAIIEINVQNNAGNTPLHYAALQGHLEIAQCLVEHQANPLIKTTRDKPPYS